MVLVNYSDSDSDEPESQKDRPSSNTLSNAVEGAKSASVKDTSFSKQFVDRSESGKIRVNLSNLTDTKKPAGTSDKDASVPQRPLKRARTGGIFSGFNSFLPAAQNASKTSKIASSTPVTGSLTRNHGAGLGSGISLKTGATPAFSKQQAEETVEQEAARIAGYIPPETSAHTVKADPDQEVKLVGKPMMFKPLSVSRKKPKKNQALMKHKTELNRISNLTDTTAAKTPPVQDVAQSRKKKQSLFSTYSEEAMVLPADPPEEIDTPRNPEDEGVEDGNNEDYDVQDYKNKGGPELTSFQSQTVQSSDLQSLANTLGLTAAQKRQLFGRKEDAANASVTNFSLAAEYSHNNKLIETQAAAPAHNPVVSITPGKHSLQQLVNVATSQKDALEESFASGKRNRKDAGSRYGW